MESNIEEKNKRKQIQIQRILHPSDQDIKDVAYNYALFQANIQRFLPNLNIKNFEELYKQFRYHKCIVFFDQFDLKKLDEICIVNNSGINILPSNLKGPSIFATFHYGSYRVINSYLLKQGFKVVLIIDDFVYKDQKEKLENLYLKHKEEALKNNSDFIILNVKEPAFIFKLKRLLLNGYVLVVYMDGNAGSLKKIDFNKGWLEIDFLNSKINVKSGIVALSYILKASIVPVITCWDDNENLEIKFYNSISTSDYSDRNLYIKDTILKLYSILEEKLYTNPTQWECWSYIHKWFEKKSLSPYEEIDIKNLKYEFNKHRYSLFSLKNEYYFFDKFSYLAFPINENLYNLLRDNNISKIANNMLEDLINKNVII